MVIRQITNGRPKIQEGMILLRRNLKTDCLTFLLFPIIIGIENVKNKKIFKGNNKKFTKAKETLQINALLILVLSF